jgi:hypothetical protein
MSGKTTKNKKSKNPVAPATGSIPPKIVPVDQGTKPASSQNPHDKCKQVIMFHNILCKFWTNLKGVLPECKTEIRVGIARYKKTERKVYLDEVHAAMTPHIKRIAEFDEGIFSDDYQAEPLMLLPEMDFKIIMGRLADCDMTEELKKQTQKSIFNHLQNIYISVDAAVAQVGAFNRSLAKQKEFLMSMLENLNLDDKLKERVAAMKNEEDAEAAGGGLGGLGGLAGLSGLGDMFSPEKLNELLGGDNFMLQLAQEVAGELDFGVTDLSNPTSALMNLFADNGKKFQELVVTIGDKIQSKVQSGEVDSEKLMRDAQLMKSKFQGAFGNIPGISDLLNGGGMLKQFKTLFAKMSAEEQATFAHIPGILDKNMPDWTEDDKAQFEVFMKQAGPKPF